MSDALKALIIDMLNIVIVGSIFPGALLIVLIGRNYILRWRHHHPLANWPFKRQREAEHPQDSRATEAPPNALAPPARLRPTDADTPRPPAASVGPQRSQL